MAYGIRRIATGLKQYGPVQVAEDIALRGVNRIIFFKVLHCMKVDNVAPRYLTPPDAYSGAFLDYEQLIKVAGQPEWELSHAFLDQALAKADQCYGFRRNGVLAAYQWYSTEPTDTGWRNLAVNFSNDYVYMYKGFTHPDHRGNRLYPIGVTTALAHYLSLGYKGILSFVESNNFASLRACYQMGYRDFGKMYVIDVLDRCRIFADASCEQYDFRLQAKQ